MKSTLKMLCIVLVAIANLNNVVNAANGEKLYTTKSCVACHGVAGKVPLMPLYPKLDGQNSAYLIQQMQDIKSGARNNSMTIVMKGIMGIVNDAEMKAIAEWLASIK